MTETEAPRARWATRVWGFLALAQAVLLALALIAMARGTPDAYLNQHARLAAGAAAGLCLALGYLLPRPALQVVAMVGTVAAIVWQISLTA